MGNLVCNNSYQDVRTRITSDVSKCMNGFIEQTRQKQARSTSIFTDMYLKLEIHYLPLLLIDVDIFKSVNDTYGHAAGDATLKKAVGCLKRAFRSIDYGCRIGGDEFSVIMVDVTSCLKYTIEDKIKYVSEELAKVESEVPAVTLSIGVAFSDQENPGESIFKDADKALYHVKENGRNGCAFYNGASSMGSIEGIEKDLKEKDTEK